MNTKVPGWMLSARNLTNSTLVTEVTGLTIVLLLRWMVPTMAVYRQALGLVAALSSRVYCVLCLLCWSRRLPLCRLKIQACYPRTLCAAVGSYAKQIFCVMPRSRASFMLDTPLRLMTIRYIVISHFCTPNLKGLQHSAFLMEKNPRHCRHRQRIWIIHSPVALSSGNNTRRLQNIHTLTVHRPAGLPAHNPRPLGHNTIYKQEVWH